ncbi:MULTISPECIES: hypothetical protein [Haloarcula]|uniref:Uncharacterized protein n=1 Tax=Haloarcula pellucida TaxID=1427151 RepID=A0A830GLZ5_9EURY|nr:MULTISPECIES: hypothetical protein [Halomicroarcula]MBX0350454.1 hypothetical protein [Halomicroarcula pellucida]MDS0278706.1 hypothetical protein [Halomicroarcula sp. S1AR25-4]GGN91099.1 hypothetical protein GCM10009030_13680 [Halomicroarcula pellucida]
MDEMDTDADRMAEAIDAVGVDRLTDAIVDVWERAGLDTGTPTWPDDGPRFRVRPPAGDTDARVDALAAVLDASPRRPDELFVYLDVGRRAGLTGRPRFELETLSGHADVTVDGDHTAGTVPLTGETFDAVTTLVDEVTYLLVRDADGVALVEWREETVRFTVPEDALSAVRTGLDAATADRVERC